MRKCFLVFCILIAITTIITIPAMAVKDETVTSNGQPFLEIWTAINNLQNQINNIQLTPGPQGPKGDPGSSSCEVSVAEFNALKARAAVLESGCKLAPETCNGVDDNCDNIVDNGAICGPGKECSSGRCVISSDTECFGILSCVNSCNDDLYTCSLGCMENASDAAKFRYSSLYVCSMNSCGNTGTGTPFMECIENSCSMELNICLSS